MSDTRKAVIFKLCSEEKTALKHACIEESVTMQQFLEAACDLALMPDSGAAKEIFSRARELNK